MKYLTHIPAILFFLVLLSSGCDNQNAHQETKEDLNPSGRESLASDTPQKQVEKILGQTRPTPPATAKKELPLAAPAGADLPTASLESKNTNDLVLGKKVYLQSCALCHDHGVAGAPLLGAQKEWTSRIAKGQENLVKNALQGFQGSKGVMPPKGGNPNLSDAEVKAAVLFMIDSLKPK